MIVYDGITGIHQVTIRNDTVVMISPIPKSPADKAGMKFYDQIISINDSLVSGRGMSVKGVKRLLQDQSGKSIELKIKRKGEDELLTFAFERDPYLYQIDSYDYLYLPDSLALWDIHDIMSGGLDTLFMDPLKPKITVFSVEKGSPAEKHGILPGDQIISLAEEVNKEYYHHIASNVLYSFTTDTSITILRDDSIIHLPVQPSVQGELKGLQSQFNHDCNLPCVWLKVNAESRITGSRNYLVNLPELDGKDSLNFFYTSDSGEIIEKKSGILFPVQDRDFIFKDWHAVSFPLKKGETQTFYLRLRAVESVGIPYLQVFAHETIVSYDRVERMVLSGFLGTMLIISVFFLFLFFVIRKRQNLYFALYIGSLAIFLFIRAGYLDEYYWTEDSFFLSFMEKFKPYFMSWVSLFFLLFGIAFLELRKTLKHWYISVVVLLSLTGIRIILVLFEALFTIDYPGVFEGVMLIVWVFTVAIIPLFILILPAIFRIRSGFRPAWYFLVSNLVLIAFTYITLVSSEFSFTIISLYESMFSRIFINSGVYIAAVVQILIFTYGLTQKMRLDELEKEKIQKQIIDQLRVNEKLKDQVNRELEQKVKVRTREINDQKEEIESQRDEIEAQRDLVFEQNKEITDSINYAQRIQSAILPAHDYLKKVMPEHFILFKPKDIVSGDFYWIKEIDGQLIVVGADCTGHGVPGGFMSMLGITLLNDLAGRSDLDQPGEILGQLRLKIKLMLAQEGNIQEQKDGMDMALFIINKDKGEIQFAGANSPLYLIRKKEPGPGKELEPYKSTETEELQLFEIKGNKQPIGIYWEEVEFVSHTFSLQKQDSIYIFSDGIIDQYGGPKRKKYKAANFKKLLLSVQGSPMREQKQLIEDTFESWRNDFEQIDDVCLIGVRI